MPTIKFFVEKRKQHGELKAVASLRATFHFDGHILTLGTGISVHIKNWHQKNQRITKSEPGCVELNMMLSNMRDNLMRTYRELHLTGVDVTPQMVKDKFRISKKSDDTIPPVNTLLQEFDSYIKLKTVGGTRTFWAHVPSTQKYLTEFIGSRIVTFADVDMNFCEGFAASLTAKGLTMNTVASHLKRFRIFLNHATKNGDNSNLRYKAYRTKESETEIFFLTMQEIKLLMEVKLSARLERIRDCFIIGCHTGLRYSDLAHLKKCDIMDGFIRFRVLKTQDIHSVPLITLAKNILKKYSINPGPFALPLLSNQKMNEGIKEIAAIAKLNNIVTLIRYIGLKRIEVSYKKCDLISTHWMRKSFISNSLIMGIPQEQVMALSNHKSFNSFKKYFKVRDEEKQNAMKKWEEFYP